MKEEQVFSNRNDKVIWGDVGENRSFKDRWCSRIEQSQVTELRMIVCEMTTNGENLNQKVHANQSRNRGENEKYRLLRIVLSGISRVNSAIPVLPVFSGGFELVGKVTGVRIG